MDNARDLIPEINADDDAIASLDAAADSVGEIISDRHLNRAIGACCTDDYGRLHLSKPVRNLIARYAPPDRPTMDAIPQERRRPFLNELASITGRALPLEEPVPAEQVFGTHGGRETVNVNEATAAEPTLAGSDEKLIINSYEPIAVNGKVPVAKGWNTRPSTAEAIAAERACHPGARSTGLRTGRLVGVDIDIVPAEHVEAITNLAFDIFGFALLERVGAKGAMLCYRNETPIGKITVSGKHQIGAGKIEILGTGQQFVSYGIHPDTGKPYSWTNALLDGEPLRTPLDKLPEVAPDRLRDFAERAEELLRGLGYTDVKTSGTGEVAEKKQLDVPAADLDVDAPINIHRAQIWLRSRIERGDVAVEGQGGDVQTFRVACRLRDFWD